MQCTTLTRFRGWSEACARRRAIVSTSLAAAFCALSITAAAAADYPTRAVHMIVPFAAGSNVDLTARQFAPRLSQVLGQPVVIENRAGAGGTIGATAAAKAAPDGYTILLGNAPTHGMAPSLYKNLAYDPIKDFVAVGRVDTAAFVLAVSSTLPVRSVAELIAYAKAHPGELNFASSGNGTTAHLAGVSFNNRTGLDIKHIPYNNNQVLVDIGSGAISMMFYPYQALVPVVQSNKVRILATTGVRRASYLPNVPTMAEAGVPNFFAAAWHGFYAPAGTPKPIVDTLYAALTKTMEDPKVVEALVAIGAEVDLAPPDEFAAFTKAEVDRYRQVMALAGVKVE